MSGSWGRNRHSPILYLGTLTTFKYMDVTLHSYFSYQKKKKKRKRKEEEEEEEVSRWRRRRLKSVQGVLLKKTGNV